MHVPVVFQAQGLSSAITTTDKLRVSNDRVYVICDGKGSLVKGFLRLGKKHLFLYPVSEEITVFGRPTRRLKYIAVSYRFFSSYLSPLCKTLQARAIVSTSNLVLYLSGDQEEREQNYAVVVSGIQIEVRLRLERHFLYVGSRDRVYPEDISTSYARQLLQQAT